ncbi:MAG: hypothetical protein Q8861_04730 [Bacteroidota bacterium]|nr:hypothetical protein [Bacteroidota bacterium]
MKRTLFFLFVAGIISISSLHAQQLYAGMGGIKTHFQIYSDTTSLEVTDQILIKQAEKKSYIDFADQAGYGYGYESYHLEFATNKALIVENFKKRAGRDNEKKIKMIFIDANHKELATVTRPFSSTNSTSSSQPDNSCTFYSIDLINIPFLLLDKTATINLIALEAI